MKNNLNFAVTLLLVLLSCGCMVEPPVVPQTAVTALQTGSTRYLLDVFFENAVQGCAVGDSGIILSTTNGGASWNTIVLDTPIQASAYLNSTVKCNG